MVIPRFKPAIGGAEECVYQMAKRLVKRGHEVVIYTSDLIRATPHYEYIHYDDTRKFDGVLVRRFHALRFLKNYQLVPTLVPILFKEKADIVHAHVFGCFTSDVAALISGVRKIPLVLSPHGFFGAGLSTHPLSHAYLRFSQISTLRIAKKIICPSKADAEHYGRLTDPAKIEVIPNGIDLNYWCKLPKEGFFRNKHGINGPLIVGVGRITPGKGFQYLIRAIPRVLEQLPNVTLAIAGEDFGYLKSLRKLAHDLKIDQHVIFVNLSDQEIKKLYVDSDLVAIPSIYEGFPIVALEAMACGKPIVASSVGGLLDIIEHGVNGLLVTQKNPAELARGIITLIKNKKLCNKIGNFNKYEVAKYSWDRIVDKVESLYQEIWKLATGQV